MEAAGLRFLKISTIFVIITTMVFCSFGFSAVMLFALTGEIPALSLTGTQNASSVLTNMNFTDVRASNTWAKSAIYESAALELMKGSSKVFGINNNLTVEQALAVAYNAVGREAEAQKAAETLDLARAANARLYPAPKMWSDGYIQLAYNDGLISFQDYTDAISANQATLSPTSFNRAAFATREQTAEYMAKLLGLTPINSQTKIFNSYNDWSSADPHIIPYIEAILQNRIMSDDGKGNFKPKGYVTRAEMAQILVNAEPLIFRKLGIQKMKGAVESVTLNQDLSTGNKINSYVINIRNSNGDLHQLSSVEVMDNAVRNEQTGSIQNLTVSSVVNRNNSLGLAGSLKAGEQINYFINANNEAPYIQVISPGTDVRYYLGKVASTDPTKKQISFSSYLELPFSDMRLADNKTLSKIQPTDAVTLYSVSNAVRVYSDSDQGGIDMIKTDTLYVISVKNGVVDTLTKTAMGLMEEAGLVSGVVKEVNPSLGYITLYFSDGSGAAPGTSDSLTELRTFSYVYDVPMIRDGKSASFEDITPGDYAFIKLDEDGYIAKLGAQSHYNPLYGSVYLKGPANLVLKLDDGTYRTIPVSKNVPVYRDDKPSSWDDIKEGDHVKILVQTNGENTSVAGIDLEKDSKPISAVYRGDVEYYDDLNNALALSRVQEFVNGRWEETPFIGVKTFIYNRDYKDRPTGRISGKAYIAVKQDVDGSDKIVIAAIRAMPQYETTFSDNLVALSNTLHILELEGNSSSIGFDSGTIAIKDGRLVDMAALDVSDPVMISADKPVGANTLVSQVVVSNTENGNGGLTVYRGRIKTVDPLKTFTVESFAELTGTSWTFSNTPKTFDMDLSATRLLEDDGIGNMRGFDSTYVNKSVYIVTDGSKALMISTAPYADTLDRGRVSGLTGGTADTTGAYTTNPTGLSLKEAMHFDITHYLWESAPNLNVNVPSDAIVLKDGKVTDITAIRAGDYVRIVGNSASHDGIIIIAE